LRMNCGKARIGYLHCRGYRHVIAIQGNQLPRAAQPRQNRAAMSTAAEGSIHVDAVGLDAQCLNRFLKQYRLM